MIVDPPDYPAVLTMKHVDGVMVNEVFRKPSQELMDLVLKLGSKSFADRPGQPFLHIAHPPTLQESDFSRRTIQVLYILEKLFHRLSSSTF